MCHSWIEAKASTISTAAVDALEMMTFAVMLPANLYFL
jgi:hypothetical protein